MERVIVLCNVPHVIVRGVCALCERDKANAKIKAAEEMAKAATHFLSMRFEIFPSVSGKEECKALHGFEAALTAWEKAGKGEGWQSNIRTSR